MGNTNKVVGKRQASPFDLPGIPEQISALEGFLADAQDKETQTILASIIEWLKKLNAGTLDKHQFSRLQSIIQQCISPLSKLGDSLQNLLFMTSRMIPKNIEDPFSQKPIQPRDRIMTASRHMFHIDTFTEIRNKDLKNPFTRHSFEPHEFDAISKLDSLRKKFPDPSSHSKAGQSANPKHHSKPRMLSGQRYPGQPFEEAVNAMIFEIERGFKATNEAPRHLKEFERYVDKIIEKHERGELSTEKALSKCFQAKVSLKELSELIIMHHISYQEVFDLTPKQLSNVSIAQKYIRRGELTVEQAKELSESQVHRIITDKNVDFLKEESQQEPPSRRRLR